MTWFPPQRNSQKERREGLAAAFPAAQGSQRQNPGPLSSRLTATCYRDLHGYDSLSQVPEGCQDATSGCLSCTAGCEWPPSSLGTGPGQRVGGGFSPLMRPKARSSWKDVAPGPPTLPPSAGLHTPRPPEADGASDASLEDSGGSVVRLQVLLTTATMTGAHVTIRAFTRARGLPLS